MWRRRMSACAAALAMSLLAFAAGGVRAGPVVDSINGDAAPPFLAFANSNAGWIYTPVISLLLDGLYSTFRNVGSPTQQGPVLPRTVTVSIYDTHARGALLARTSFTADGSGGNLGGAFAPVLLLAGHKYFIAYDNIYNIGLNIPNWIPAQAPGTVNLDGWYTGENFLTYHPKFIDGVLQVFSAPILRFQGIRVTTLPSADCLFDWAERNYLHLFAPAGRTSQTTEAYYYRYYPTTNAYLGVSTANNHVYYLGPDRVLSDVGALPGWLATAGCPQPQ